MSFVDHYSSYYNYEWSIDDQVTSAAEKRLCIIDKKYALEKIKRYPYAQTPGFYLDNGCYSEADDEIRRSPSRNFTMDNNTERLSNDFWSKIEFQNTRNKYPKTFRAIDKHLKTGKLDPNFTNTFNKEFFGTDQDDKRQLHRKRSLNREL